MLSASAGTLAQPLTYCRPGLRGRSGPPGEGRTVIVLDASAAIIEMRLLPSSTQYSSSVEVVAYDSTLCPEILDAWRRSAHRAGGVRSACQGPEWTQYRVLRQFIPEPSFKLAVLYDNTGITSVTPVTKDTFLLKCLWGSRPLVGLRNTGSEFLLPPSAEFYDAFIKGLFCDSEIDYLRVVVPADDPFLAFLLKKHRRPDWLVFAPSQTKVYYHWINLSIGQQAYWARFTRKQQYNFNRELRTLASLGNVECVRISSAEEAATFADAATTIGAKTWQYRGPNSIAREIEKEELQSLLVTMSGLGMLRSYLLKVGDEYICFWTSFQQESVFWLYDTGFNPIYAKYSPGKCLLQLIINDLFAHNLPSSLSFGLMADDYHYKKLFATNTIPQNEVLLLRNTLKNYLCLFPNRRSNVVRGLKKFNSQKPESSYTRARGPHAEPKNAEFEKT